MRATVGLRRPFFELPGISSRIDLSAWISGACFSFGLALCGRETLYNGLVKSHAGFAVLAAAFAAFLISVMLIQRYMRLSLLANTFGTPRRLITGGVFRYSRNPIYVAFFMPLASIAYFSLSASAVATAVYIVTMTLTVIHKEERDLRAAFGAEYAMLLSTVPRWII